MTFHTEIISDALQKRITYYLKIVFHIIDAAIYFLPPSYLIVSEFEYASEEKLRT